MKDKNVKDEKEMRLPTTNQEVSSLSQRERNHNKNNDTTETIVEEMGISYEINSRGNLIGVEGLRAVDVINLACDGQESQYKLKTWARFFRAISCLHTDRPEQVSNFLEDVTRYFYTESLEFKKAFDLWMTKHLLNTNDESCIDRLNPEAVAAIKATFPTLEVPANV